METQECYSIHFAEAKSDNNIKASYRSVRKSIKSPIYWQIVLNAPEKFTELQVLS